MEAKKTRPHKKMTLKAFRESGGYKRLPILWIYKVAGLYDLNTSIVAVTEGKLEKKFHELLGISPEKEQEMRDDDDFAYADDRKSVFRENFSERLEDTGVICHYLSVNELQKGEKIHMVLCPGCVIRVEKTAGKETITETGKMVLYTLDYVDWKKYDTDAIRKAAGVPTGTLADEEEDRLVRHITRTVNADARVRVKAAINRSMMPRIFEKYRDNPRFFVDTTSFYDDEVGEFPFPETALPRKPIKKVEVKVPVPQEVKIETPQVAKFQLSLFA